MQVNSISNTNPNFQAKFVMDSKGILREAYQFGKMTDVGNELLGKFSRMGKDQEVEFVNRFKNQKFIGDDRFEIFNNTTGKTVSVCVGRTEALWDKILKALVDDKEFFEPNRFWQELTGQKKVTWTKK